MLNNKNLYQNLICHQKNLENFDKTIEWTKKEKFDPSLKSDDPKGFNILNDIEKFNLLSPNRKYV